MKLHQNLAECKFRKILVNATALLSALHKRQIVMCVYAYRICSGRSNYSFRIKQVAQSETALHFFFYSSFKSARGTYCFGLINP